MSRNRPHLSQNSTVYRQNRGLLLRKIGRFRPQNQLKLRPGLERIWRALQRRASSEPANPPRLRSGRQPAKRELRFNLPSAKSRQVPQVSSAAAEVIDPGPGAADAQAASAISSGSGFDRKIA